MEGSYEHIKLLVAGSPQGVILQLGCWVGLGANTVNYRPLA